jgi:hypothetical protein
MQQAVTFVELDVPHCALDYGVLPCHAHLGYDDDNEGPFAAVFDGTDDYLLAGGELSAVNGKQGTLSCWIDLLAGDGAVHCILNTSTGKFGFKRETDNKLRVTGANAAGTIIMLFQPGPTTVVATEWVHALASWNLATGVLQFAINDVLSTVITVNTNDTIDYTDTNFAVGSEVATTNKVNGRIADLWVSMNTHIDLSVTANRRKFIDANGRPAFLGETGELPTGSSPHVFLSGAISTWHTNKGFGGPFTLNGELGEFPFGAAKCFNSLGTCQDRENFDDDPVTLRFAEDVGFLPREIDALPFIKQLDVTPAIVSLSGDLGQRATVRCRFKNARHSDAGVTFDKYPLERDYSDPYSRGTFWGKFRARNPFLRSRPFRLIRGFVGDALADMETRHYLVDSIEGPSANGEFSIVAKDVLKIADGDRALAPALSAGFLVSGINNAVTSATLSPTGIGSTYAASGHATIGGTEVVSFTRSGDVLTITRGQLNTTAVAHDTGDRVQEMLRYVGEDGAVILEDLWDRAGADPAWISLAAWQAETAAFLGVVYTLNIAEPTPVNKLISEMLQYMGAAQWWDDINQQIRLQILRAVATTADRYNEDNVWEGSLEVKEQPDKRVSRVIVYFGQISPLKKIDDLDNYRSTEEQSDSQSEEDEGSQSIKRIFARGIAAGGRTVAEALATKYLSRYVRPPRRFTLELLRGSVELPLLGGGYRLGGGSPRVSSWPFEDETGDRVDLGAQVTSVDPDGVRPRIELEEMLFTAFGAEVNPDERSIIFDTNENNVNLRTRHDELYPEPTTGNEVTATINAGIIIGSVSTALRAFDVGSWPVGVTINLIVIGRIQGAGGPGGNRSGGTGTPGGAGGTALYTRYAINLTSSSGDIWGGGGGGAGDADGGGGGGAGQLPGAAGTGPPAGSAGTTEAGGAGGGGGSAGGGPGLAGQNSSDAAGGAAGTAIDGDSFVTDVGTPGDIRGPQIN